MDAKLLADITAADAARTPGEWRQYRPAPHYRAIHGDADGESVAICILQDVHHDSLPNDEENAAFIALCSVAVPALLKDRAALLGLLDDAVRGNEYQMGAAEERRACIEVVRNYLPHAAVNGLAYHQTQMAMLMEARGPVPQDACPVGEVRAENERLKAALRGIADSRFWDRSDPRNVDEMRRVAREALGGEAEP